MVNWWCHFYFSLCSNCFTFGHLGSYSVRSFLVWKIHEVGSCLICHPPQPWMWMPVHNWAQQICEEWVILLLNWTANYLRIGAEFFSDSFCLLVQDLTQSRRHKWQRKTSTSLPGSLRLISFLLSQLSSWTSIFSPLVPSPRFSFITNSWLIFHRFMEHTPNVVDFKHSSPLKELIKFWEKSQSCLDIEWFLSMHLKINLLSFASSGPKPFSLFLNLAFFSPGTYFQTF